MKKEKIKIISSSVDNDKQKEQENGPEKSISWEEVNKSIKKIAKVTGEGINYIYSAGKKNVHFVVPFLNGLIGDKLAEYNDELAIKMSFRKDLKDIDITSIKINSHANKKQTVVLFIHGLMGDEMVWNLDWENCINYPSKLKEDFGFTPLFIRYNSGLHLSENGKILSDLLEDFYNAHKDKVDKIIMIGHSMGALVARSAGHYAMKDNRKWKDLLDKMFLLGSPNTGAILEKFSHLVGFVLKSIVNYHTILIGKIIDERSNGIKDLRFGVLAEEDWKRKNYDNLLYMERTDIMIVPDVKHYVIGGTIAEDEQSPLNIFFGDGMISKNSAIANRFFDPKDPLNEIGTIKIFNGKNHAELTSNIDIYNYIKECIEND